MNPLLINTHIHGGAAKACLRLHQGLLQEGINSHLLTNDFGNIAHASVYQEQEYSTPQQPSLSLKSWLHEKRTSTFANAQKQYKAWQAKQKRQSDFLNSRPKGLEYFSFPTSNYDLTKILYYQKADIINLHWVANFLNYESFLKKNKKPIVWTLHDMNPFTGGEHYIEWYGGISEEGKPLTRNYTCEEKLKQKEVLNFKQQLFNNVENLHIVTPSVWLTQEAEKSNIFNTKHYQTIPNGVDTDMFKSIPKIEAKKVLGLPTDVPIILFVAQSLNNQRKGFIYLQKALEKLKQKNVLICAVGDLQTPLQSNNIIELGSIQDERLMSIVYNAADVFVIPSLMDNLPNTVLESLCCGTPVIGFPVGGIVDMVQHDKNGYLCPEISVQSLQQTIEKFLENPSVFNRENIAKEAAAKYALEVQAKKYISLYEEILSSS